MATNTYGTTTPRSNTTMYWVIGALAVLIVIAFMAMKNPEQVPTAGSSPAESTTTNAPMNSSDAHSNNATDSRQR